MSQDNPYRAAGAFRGKAYIRREADAQLIEQIEDNQYYPYFAAPRQSGKSSLLMRTMSALAPAKYRCALVDLSPFVVASYDDFWRQFLHEVARSANFDPTPIGQEDPRDVFLMWLRSCQQRLIVFMDEIDVLLNVDCREQIFSKFRTFFNMRARPDTAELERLQFVLAGAAHSSRFIKDPRWSPFNVAIEIELEDLTAAQVSQLSAYLATAGAFAGPDLTSRVYDLTGGSVFLCQLVFEQLWNLAARGNQRLGAADVDAVIESIVAESPRNIHFYNIFRLVTADARLSMLFRRLTDGQELGFEEQKELRLTGLCRGASPFRNEVYARVFGPGGPLDLKVGSKQIELGKQLDAALARRERLRNDTDADAAQAAEAEVRRLRREFREGTSLQVGDVLGRGRWRVDEKIGQGGFATVWRAFDGKTQQDVALKVLHGQFAEDRTRRDRFFRGAWKMSELKHPGIVEVVEPYAEENGYYYFVMEYLRDGTLHEAVLGKKVGTPAVLRIVTMVGQALQFAHARGLVHRDVKPTNVLVSGDAGKLTDFDLVRETDVSGQTKTGAMGTFLYAAPEVMSRPQDADARADVYGLGMTAVFALHGEDLAMDVIRDTDRFIERLKCAPAVHEVLKKAVAWDREHRFGSCEAFVAALEQAGREPPRRKSVAGPNDSQRGIAEWGGAAGDGMLLGPARSRAASPAAKPSPPARGPVPQASPATAKSAASAGPVTLVPGAVSTRPPTLAPGSSSSSRLVGDFAAMADEMPVPAPHPDALSSMESAPALDMRSVEDEESRADAAVRARTMVLDRDVDAAPAGDAVVVPLAAVEAVSVARPAASAVDAPSGLEGRALRGAEAVPRDRSERPGELQRQGVTGSQAAASHAAQQSDAQPGVRRRSRWLAYAGLAASVALVFVAIQSGIESGPATQDEAKAAAGETQAERGVLKSEPMKGVPITKQGPAVEPALPEAKKDLPPDPPTSVPPVVAENAGTFGADGMDGADETSGHDETTGPGPEDDDEGEAGGATGPRRPSTTAAGTTTTTARTTQGHETGNDSVGAAEPRVNPKQAEASFDDLLREGCSEASGGNAEKGYKKLRAAFDKNPRNLKLLECLGRANMGLNNYQAAEMYYLQLARMEPRTPKAWLGAAEANEKLGRLNNAAQYYDELRTYFPNNQSAAAFFKANPGLDPRAGRR